MQIGIAVVEQDDQFLIGQRAESVVLGGKWEFPGGKVEAGETPGGAAVRECWEEAGCRVAVERLLLVQTEAYDHGTVELHFFLCHPMGVAPVLSPFLWVARADLTNYAFPSGNRKLLELLS